MTSGRLEVSIVAGAGGPVAAELDRFFAGCPTSFAQQTTGWRDVIAAIGCDEPMMLLCRDGRRLVGALPAYRFEGPLGAILTSSAQAGPLGGVACHPEVDPGPVYRALLDAYLELAAAKGCAFATVITNPIWPDEQLYGDCLRPDYVLENACQVLDLDDALDDGGALTPGSTHVRRNLQRASDGSLRIDEAQTVANVDEWYEIHAARHRDIGAAPLPKRLFTGALERMVPGDKARFFFVRLTASGEMVGGGFYLCHGTVMDALMPSVATAHARRGPAYLLAAHSMRWARRRGVRYYNWQPSPPESGVYRFKRQWGSRDLAYYYMTCITGDAAPFLCSSVDVVARAYRWHYVLPFDRIGAPVRTGVTSRSAAWRAAGTREVDEARGTSGASEAGKAGEE